MSSFPLRTFLAALLASSCFVPVAQAATITWDGGAGTSSWFDANNWSGNAVPTSSDEVRLDAIGVDVNGLVESTATLSVGHTGTASLAIENGGAVTSSSGNHIFVGNASGSNGTITVNGTNSTLESGNQLIVGYHGTGRLTISDGGNATADSSIYAGYLTDGVGTIVVTGSDSMLESGKHFFVGYSGSGSLTVSDGGTVSSASGYNIYAGTYTGSTGTITVTDIGSTLESGNAVVIGNYGTGTLTISGGGYVGSTDDSIYVGYNAGSTGTITVTGSGSTLASGRNVYIGQSGTGTLVISDGGIVSDAYGEIGTVANSIGTVTVVGTGSRWTNSDILYVGRSGSGTMLVSSGGTVSSGTSYIGAWSNSTGDVTVTGLGSTLESGQNISVGNAGDGTLTVSDSGTVSTSGVLTIAADTVSTGTLNIGAASGSSAVAPGTVTASRGIVFGGGTGTIVFNHTSTNYTFASSISGVGTIESVTGTTYLTGDLSGFSGTFDLEGGTLSVVTSGVQTLSNSLSGSGTMAFASGTTYLTGDSSSFTGTAAVSGSGILSVNGTLGGTVDVADGGTLKGSGTVGGIDAASGGTVAPGNSIGTLSVSGNVSFASGSTYDVEANLTSSDKIVATGAATITGGDVSLIAYQGALLRAGTTYTILTADGGVSGTFDSISFADPLLFLTATLSYDATDVYASVIRNGVSLASVAGSGNQANAAAAIESLGAGNAVYDAVAMQSDVGTTRQAYQALSGEIHANVKATLLEDQAAFGRVLAGRLAQAEDNQTGFAAPVTAPAPVVASARGRILYGDKIANDAAVANAKIAPTVWAQGFGGWGSRDGDANARDFKHQDKGLMLGVDGMMGDNWRLGLAFGYDHADYNQEDETGDKGTSERYSVSAYGGRSWGKLSLRTGLTYAYSDIDTKRGVSFPYYSDYLKGSYNAHSVSGFAETAYGFGDKESKIEPFANLAWGYVNVPGFTEKGGAAALTAEDSDGTLGSTTLGARVRQVLPFLTSANNRAAFQASAGWMHAIGDANPETSLRFAGSRAFETQAAPLARDAAVLGAGVDYLIGQQTTLGLAYTGQIGAHADTQALRGNLSYRF